MGVVPTHGQACRDTPLCTDDRASSIARFLILGKVDCEGQARWERIGRLTLMLSEGMMDRYGSVHRKGMIDDLRPRNFGEQMVLM